MVEWRAMEGRLAEIAVLLRLRYSVSGVGIWVEAKGNESHVCGLRIDTANGYLSDLGEVPPFNDLGRTVERQLHAYFDSATSLNLPLWDHRDKQNQVAAMEFLRNIPCGQSRSYAQQARAVRNATGTAFNARNAGNANHNNHYPLAIPCHRVVRSDGSVGGFMGSSRDAACDLKRALLRHEAIKAGSPVMNDFGQLQVPISLPA